MENNDTPDYKLACEMHLKTIRAQARIIGNYQKERAQPEVEKAFADLMTFGTSIMVDSKHVPAADFLAPAQEQAKPSEEPRTELIGQLLEYAGNPGFSHGDYADTMKQAASCIEQLSYCVKLYQGKYAAASAELIERARPPASPSPERSGESGGVVPVLWVESEPSTRLLDLAEVMQGTCHTVMYHTFEPRTGNPVWPLYTRPAPAASSSAAPSDPYAAITLSNLKAGKLTAARVYVAYCELKGELESANGAIERYKALAAPAPTVAAPDCGACPGDGTVCAASCKLAEESPAPTVAAPSRQWDEFGRTNSGDETGGTVQRFGFDVTGPRADIIPATNGAFVYHSDYVELFKKHAALAAPTGASQSALTDADIVDISNSVGPDFFHASWYMKFARAIERHLAGATPTKGAM